MLSIRFSAVLTSSQAAPEATTEEERSTEPVFSDTETTADTEPAVREESTTPSNSVEATTVVIEPQTETVIETVQLPQNRIPLRLLQRNRWLPKTTTTETEDSTVTEVATTPQPSFQRGGKPVENMIMDKSRPNGAGSSFLQENTGKVQQQSPRGDEPDELVGPIEEKENRFIASSARRELSQQQQQPQPQPVVLERAQTPIDYSRMQPINRHFQMQYQQGPPQQLRQAPVDVDPRRNVLNDMVKPVYGGSLGHFRADGRPQVAPDSVRPPSVNETDMNNTTPLPLPVPLESVPFYLRPRQEIQNRLLEAEWRRAGLNISLYLSTPASTNSSNATESTTPTTTPAPTTTTTVPTTTQEPTTVPTTTTSPPLTGQARSIFAEFMVNKNENAREYLKAIFENALGGERQAPAPDWRALGSHSQQVLQQQYQYQGADDRRRVRI